MASGRETTTPSASTAASRSEAGDGTPGGPAVQAAAPDRVAGAAGARPLTELIGERLRSARSARGWSVGSLARSAGIGKGSLSEIENGVRNPTLGTLYALANTLGLPLSWLLAEQTGAEVSSPGITARLLDTSTVAGTTVEVYAIRLSPDGRHVSGAHGPGVIEHLLVVDGRVRAGVGGAEVDVDTCASTTWVSDRTHTYRALDGRTADVVLVIRWPSPTADVAAGGRHDSVASD